MEGKGKIIDWRLFQDFMSNGKESECLPFRKVPLKAQENPEEDRFGGKTSTSTDECVGRSFLIV